jgi:hypothetical protein
MGMTLAGFLGLAPSAALRNASPSGPFTVCAASFAAASTLPL